MTRSSGWRCPRSATTTIRNDYKAIETYTCDAERKICCPITVLTGDYDPSTTLDEADAWRVHTTDALPLKSYPGGHLYLSKHQSAVNNELAQEIADLTVPEPA